MNVVVEPVNATQGSLVREEDDARQGSEIIEFIPRDRIIQRERRNAQLEAENAALRRELQNTQRLLMQKDVLLRNARIRELELRAVLVRLMC